MGVIHHRSDNGPVWSGWDGVEAREYSKEDAVFHGVRRHVLIGADEGAENFVIRYFSVPPGKSTNLDEHHHDHGVIVVNGHARVLLGTETHLVGPGDAVYIPEWERHQFTNESETELFTFICVIPPKTSKYAPDAG